MLQTFLSYAADKQTQGCAHRQTRMSAILTRLSVTHMTLTLTSNNVSNDSGQNKQQHVWSD